MMANCQYFLSHGEVALGTIVEKYSVPVSPLAVVIRTLMEALVLFLTRIVPIVLQHLPSEPSTPREHTTPHLDLVL